MSKRKTLALPQFNGDRTGIQSYVSPQALSRWDSGVKAASEGNDERSISIYDVIGYDWWTGEGVTAKRVAGALRAMGRGPVTVNVNSPGGDVFEGITIYNLLREHDGEVTVRVLGLAASAASVIAMAGDNIQIGKSAFFMVHNTWVAAVGNQHDLREIAEWLEPFDSSMAEVYADRTGIDVAEIRGMLDNETWLSGTAAVERGFATEYLDSDNVLQDEERASAKAVRTIQAALQQAGLPRSEQNKIIYQFKSSLRDAADSSEREAAEHSENKTAVARARLMSESLKTILR